MKIVINHAVMLNGGDAAIAFALRDLAVAAYGDGTEVVVHDQYGDAGARRYPELRVVRTLASGVFAAGRSRPSKAAGIAGALAGALAARFGWSGAGRLLPPDARPAFDDFRSADVIVNTGGTYLVENYSLVPVVLDCAVALLLGKPLVFFTQSLGPFRKPLNAVFFRFVFRKSAAIMVRDQASERALLALDRGLAAKITVSPDAVFFRSDEALIAARAAAPWPPAAPRVCLSVREWRHFRSRSNAEGMSRYLAAMAALATHCVRSRGADVTFLSTCQGDPAYAYDDSAVARRVVALLDPDVQARVRVDAGFHRPEELAALLDGFDCAVVTRMHACIIALGRGLPVLPIAYEFKTNELAARLGVPDWTIDIEDVSPESLVAAFDRWMSDVPARMPGVRACLTAMRRDVFRLSVDVLRRVGASAT